MFGKLVSLVRLEKPVPELCEVRVHYPSEETECCEVPEKEQSPVVDSTRLSFKYFSRWQSFTVRTLFSSKKK